MDRPWLAGIGTYLHVLIAGSTGPASIMATACLGGWIRLDQVYIAFYTVFDAWRWIWTFFIYRAMALGA
jgi:hypothetical protein